jgi:hypothetical protein
MSWDRRITAAFVLAVFVQSCGALMWAGAAAQRITAMEVEMDKRRPVLAQATRVEVELKLMRRQLERIERRLEARDGQP